MNFRKSILAAIVGLSILCSSSMLRADEGMWLPVLLKQYNYEQMKKLGLKLKPEQIYDVNKASMKDAVVWFNGGCTGEIVSEQGLIFTNHHCGYDAIASHSSVENNILKDGFWASKLTDELPNPGMFVSILVRMEDVTNAILPAVNGLPQAERSIKMRQISDSLTKKAVEGTHYEAIVRDYFKGNQYFLLVYEKFTDIRLVGTPPEAIGKFGGDTDNWMWPRHTGDFSVFRVYAGPDNKPAPYSPENKPYKPRHYFPVSIKGFNDGDYAMVFGFPGTTNRYETSYGVTNSIKFKNPAIVINREKRLDIMKKYMDADVATRIKFASEYARLSNYWKYFKGETEQLVRLKIVEAKEKEEQEFQKWANGKAEYEKILPNIKKAYDDLYPLIEIQFYISQGIFGSKLLGYARAFSSYEQLLKGDTRDNDKIEKTGKQLLEAYDELMTEFDAKMDEEITAKVMYLYYKNLPAEQHAPIFSDIIRLSTETDAKLAVQRYVRNMYMRTGLLNRDYIEKFVANPDLDKLRKDAAYNTISNISNDYNERFVPKIMAANRIISEESGKYMKGLMEMNPKRKFYPDANSTLRLTYGKVRSYDPADGVHFRYATTLNGVMEKEKPGDMEFDVPARLKELYEKKDFGQYADKNGNLVTCFITDNDITGGNSGSPVINGKGELVGIAFDGNWEAMSGNIYFDDRYKRCINVDIRYVLWCIDKYGQAPHLIQELKIVK